MKPTKTYEIKDISIWNAKTELRPDAGCAPRVPRPAYRTISLILACGVATATLGLSGSALARPVRIVWSTYLRTGPGTGYTVVDEVQHDTVVDLRACGPRWCQIAAGATIGYIDKDALTLPRLPSGAAPAGGPQGCFVAGQYAWRTPAPTRFCETQPTR